MQVNSFNQVGAYQAGLAASSKSAGYLDSLRAKIPGVNIFAVNSPLTSKSQLSSNALGGIGTFGTVAISRDFLEKMANDKGLAEKYEKIISKVPDDMEFIKNSAPEGAKVLGAGMTIDKNGRANYWSVAATDNSADKSRTVFDVVSIKMLDKLKAIKAIKAKNADGGLLDVRG